jgi:CDP-glycerol glycerophosphotransferase (TagB/SpsB family)
LTAVTPAVATVADRPLDIDSVEWERVQVIIRARLDGRDARDAARFRLERLDGHPGRMSPTRAWIEGDTLCLRFNVMQGPNQDPLDLGRWTLVTDAGGDARGRPVRIGRHPGLAATRASMTFDLERALYHVAVAVDAATGRLDLRITLESVAVGGAGDTLAAGLRARGLRIVRGLRSQLFRAAFRVTKLLARRNGRRILFTSDSSAELAGNLRLVHDRMVERGLDREYEILTLFKPSFAVARSLRDRLRLPWVLARADTIVIDDYQPIIYRVDFDRDVRAIQLWHASGPFKTVGYSRIGKVGGPGPWSRIHKDYTRAIVGSESSVPYYAEAFGIPESRVVPTGIPRMDRFFDPVLAEAGRQAADAAFPQQVGKFTILFAPTFRGLGPRDAYYEPGWMDIAAFHALAVELDAVVLLKMHPFVREPIDIPVDYRDRLIDATRDALDVNDLLFAVDLLVTDYSSIVFEFSTLGRPMIFYAPDLEDYISARDFYIPFETFVPGPIVRTFDDLLTAIRGGGYDVERVAAFAERHFDHRDSGSTDRVIDQVILG